MIELIGKFHPLFVHLPIGFILLLAVLEWLAIRPGGRELHVANRIILLLTIPVALASVVCGWLLASNGGYEDQALFWHRWLGTSVAAGAIGLWIVRQRGWMTAYRRGLIVLVFLLTVASHFGGSLTHGSNYLSWRKPPTVELKPLTEAELLAQPVYPLVIQPVFNKYCVSCHGEKKSKGGLRMDTVEHLVRGGDSGSPIDPPGAAYSLLGKRLNLPVDHEDHMPPGGKPQPGAAQLTLIKWWLDAGAPIDGTVADLKPTPEIIQAIQSSAMAGGATATE